VPIIFVMCYLVASCKRLIILKLEIMMDLRFWWVPNKKISLESIMGYVERSPRRIHFATTHRKALRSVDDGSDVLAWLNLPFRDTVGAFVSHLTGISLYDKKAANGVCSPIKNSDQLDLVNSFIERFNEVVFLRDNLDLSVALSMNMEEDGSSRTELGECEYKVKYQGFGSDSEEFIKLKETLASRLDDLPFYKDADYVCAVPSGHTFVADMIGSLDDWKDKDISEHVYWTEKTSDIKNAETYHDKLVALGSAGLEIEDVDLRGKVVVLVDDLYKSGLTMQFVAMKLKEAGASRVFGICLVKSRGK